MEESIREFNRQFLWIPDIQNSGRLEKADKFIIVGMGGSHLAAGLLKVYDPFLDLLIHRDYGLPRVPDYFIKDSLLIFCSHSGNTEEVLDGFEEAYKQGLKVAVISSGGKLLERAREEGVPFVQIPAEGIQPRMALGYMLKALIQLVGIGEEGMAKVSALANSIDPSRYEDDGRALAENLQGKIPLIYSSTLNLPIAYNWKIKFNETGKIPAFCNAFPELNHNEMTGLRWLDEKFTVIILKDGDDHPGIERRMEVMEGLYRERGISTQIIPLAGDSAWEKIFNSLLLADWAALHTARLCGAEPEQVPIVEEFKRLLI